MLKFYWPVDTWRAILLPAQSSRCFFLILGLLPGLSCFFFSVRLGVSLFSSPYPQITYRIKYQNGCTIYLLLLCPTGPTLQHLGMLRSYEILWFSELKGNLSFLEVRLPVTSLDPTVSCGIAIVRKDYKLYPSQCVRCNLSIPRPLLILPDSSKAAGLS